MPDPKFLWLATVIGIPVPIYLVAQNMQSAQAQLAAHPRVHPADVKRLTRLDPWDAAHNMTIVTWPATPPAPPLPPDPHP